MADIFGGVEPPAWLQRLTTPSEPGLLGKIFGEMVGGLADSAEVAIDKATTKQAKGIDTNWLKELPSSIKPGLAEARLNIQNPLWKMQAQQAQLNMAQQALGIKNQQSLIDSRVTKLRMQEHDQEVLPKWLQEHPTWETRQNADPPVLYTTEGQRMYRDVQLGDAGNIKHKTVIEGINAYSKSVAQLQKLDPVAAAPFAAQIGKIPTPEMSAKLTDAISAAQFKAEQERTTAKTVRNEKGEIIGYMVGNKFEKPGSGTSTPPTGAISIRDEQGTVIGWQVGNKFITKKEEKAKPAPKLTAAQSSELTYARNRVQGLEKAMLDPANKTREGELRNQWIEARKYYNGLLKRYSPDVTPTAPATAPATAPKKMTYDPTTDQLSPY